MHPIFINTIESNYTFLRITNAYSQRRRIANLPEHVFRFLRQAQTPRENTKAMMFGENYLKEIFGIAAINSLV